MILTYVGVYTFILALFWGLFVIAKIHAYKFRNFSLYIRDVTQILTVFAVFLSILGYLVIFFGVGEEHNFEVEKQNINTNFDSQSITY